MWLPIALIPAYLLALCPGQQHAILKSLGDGRTMSRGPSTGLESSLPVTGSIPATVQSEAAAQHMPYDWTLKRSARFTSSLPLTVCERALRLDPVKGEATAAPLKPSFRTCSILQCC